MNKIIIKNFLFLFFFLSSTQLWGAINIPPTADAQNVMTNEDTPINITLNGSDPEGSSLTYSIVYSTTRGSLSGSGNTWTYTPTANFNGTDLFKFRVSDGNRWSRLATVNITVNSVNDPPTVDDSSLEVSAGDSGVVTLNGKDVENSELNFTLVDQPTQGSASITGNILTFKAANGSSGYDSLTFVASDGETNSALGTVNINILASNVVVPIDMSYLEPIPNVTITTSDDKTVITMAYQDCHVFSAPPLVLPLSDGSEGITGTFYSKCGNYVDVPKGLFLVQSNTGSVFRFISEGDLNPNASGTGFFERQTGSIWMAVENTSVDSQDSDEPTGGLVRWNGQTEYFDNWEGRETESLINLDGTILTSTLNTDKPTCQNGRKIHAELCGLLALVDANSGDMVDITSSSGEGGDDYEASPTAAPTRAIFQEGNYDRTVWGTGRGGNLYDTSLDVGGACRVFMADTQYLLDTGFNGELVNFDFFADNLDFGAISDDPGDPGCIADNSITTNYSVMEGEVSVGYDSNTKEVSYWAKEYLPGVSGSNETHIIHYDQDLHVICEVAINSGTGKTPFTGDGMVIDENGIAYTNATYFDSNNVQRTGIWAVDADCNVTKLIELNYVAIGNISFSGVTLAMDAQGEDWILTSVTGNLYAYNLNTAQYITDTLGSSSTDQVMAAPVIDSNGRVVVMSVNNIMTIFHHLKDSQGNEMHFSYGHHLWPRFRKDNFGSGTLEVVE